MLTQDFKQAFSAFTTDRHKARTEVKNTTHSAHICVMDKVVFFYYLNKSSPIRKKHDSDITIPTVLVKIVETLRMLTYFSF